MATWGQLPWSNTAEAFAGKSTGAVQRCDPVVLYNRNGEPMRFPAQTPTPNLPKDIQHKDFQFSRKCRKANPSYPALDITKNPGYSTAALTFHSKDYTRNAYALGQIEHPRDFAEFRKEHGNVAEPPINPPTQKQQFSLSNTPLRMTESCEHKYIPAGIKADFWNIKKAQNFSSAQYDIINTEYPLKPCYKWKYLEIDMGIKPF